MSCHDYCKIYNTIIFLDTDLTADYQSACTGHQSASRARSPPWRGFASPPCRLTSTTTTTDTNIHKNSLYVCKLSIIKHNWKNIVTSLFIYTIISLFLQRAFDFLRLCKVGSKVEIILWASSWLSWLKTATSLFCVECHRFEQQYTQTFHHYHLWNNEIYSF